jgi:CheY-like chemotaxis protein
MKQIKSILIVDDDSITNYINVRMLRKLNIADEIFVTTNGEDGLKCLEENCLKTISSPTLILLDINMPVMDGFEFLQKFKSLNFINKDKVIIAILTILMNPRDQRKMKELGIKYYFNKPLTQRAVLQFLNEIKVGSNAHPLASLCPPESAKLTNASKEFNFTALS